MALRDWSVHPSSWTQKSAEGIRGIRTLVERHRIAEAQYVRRCVDQSQAAEGRDNGSGTVSDWLAQRRRAYLERLKDEWAAEVGHDREWWRGESRRIGTDWSTLVRQRIRVLWWVRAGRLRFSEWKKRRDQ
jgi:hypothetical protein